MLVAKAEGLRVEARHAERGAPHFCPSCVSPVILHRGRKVIAHFAHKPPVQCDYAVGETLAHMTAKHQLAEIFRAKGHVTDVEVPIGQNRADVLITNKTSGRKLALELQHTTISPDELYMRSTSYHHNGIEQMWIPFLRSFKRFTERYSVRPYEMMIHNLFGEMLVYNPQRCDFAIARLDKHQLYVEEYESYGGYYKTSKRWCELTLEGPYAMYEIDLKVHTLASTRWRFGWGRDETLPMPRGLKIAKAYPWMTA